MYNLFVSGSDTAWDGTPFTIESSRCVSEYTDEDIRKALGTFSEESKRKLMQLPCIFAYEDHCKKHPKFGRITEITLRQGKVRILYQIIQVKPFLKFLDMRDLLFELDIGKWEMNRTHWAVKNVDLIYELRIKNIRLPKDSWQHGRIVNLQQHKFDVALSFPGEIRDKVEQIAIELERELGPDKYFYDFNYKAQLARPNLDIFLQNIYAKQSRLIVVFYGSSYQKKEWCGIEFKVIRNLINRRRKNAVMLVKIDNKPVDGIHENDGYIDMRMHSPAQIAQFICERVASIAKQK